MICGNCNREILKVLEEDDSITIDKLFYKEMIEHLERLIILLEDNPKINDKNNFYNGEDLMLECVDILGYLKGEK